MLLEEQTVEWMNKNTKVCPINNTFRLMGKKFTVLILRNMMHLGQTRFNQFLEIEEINAKILSARLKEMENDGLIKRKIFHERPVRVEYTLTEKGEGLDVFVIAPSEGQHHCVLTVVVDGKTAEDSIDFKTVKVPSATESKKK